MSDKWRLLHAENDAQWRRHIKEALEETGEWQVTECATAGEAIENIRRGKSFDVAFVDLGLEADLSARVESGAQLAQILVERGIKVGLISAQATHIATKVADSLGVPFYDKGYIVDIPAMARETLYWGLKSRQEQW